MRTVLLKIRGRRNFRSEDEDAKKSSEDFQRNYFRHVENKVASLYAKIRTIVVSMWTTTCLLVVNHEIVHESLSLVSHRHPFTIVAFIISISLKDSFVDLLTHLIAPLCILIEMPRSVSSSNHSHVITHAYIRNHYSISYIKCGIINLLQDSQSLIHSPIVMIHH